MFLKRLFAILVLSFLFILKTIAQNNYEELKDLRFKHLSIKDGLSQRSVTSILQDSKGYLWFGTRDGINIYDGTNFSVFRHNSEDNSSLSHSWITCVFEDSKKNIWIGTKNGLNRYNPKEKNFIRYKKNSHPYFVTDNEIWNIEQVDNQTLWIGTNHKITTIDIENFTAHTLKTEVEKKFVSKKIRNTCKTIDGFLWVCMPTKILKYNPQNNTIIYYNYPNNSSIEAHLNNAPKIYQDHQKTIWLGYENGLAVWDKNLNVFKDFKLNNTNSIRSSVRGFNEDNHGNLWVGTYTGLYILNKKRTHLKNFVHHKNAVRSLSQNSIYSIIKDHRGDMWIGTWAGGINYFDYSFQSFKQIYAGYSNNMLNYNVVSSIIQQENGNLLIGTEGGGLNYYHKKTGKFTYYQHNSKNPNSIGSNNIKSLLLDADKNLWIGTHDQGLFYLNLSKKPFKFQKIDLVLEESKHLKDYRILCLHQDQNQNIWIGTLTKGIFIYNRKNHQIKQLENKIKSVKCIVESNNPDTIFIGGSDGLEKINIHTQKITPLKYQRKNPSIRNSINCISVQNETIWIGTEGKGLYEIHAKTKKTTKYGIAQGLLNEVIYGILLGDDNKIWISTNSGISSLDLKTKKTENYLESNGLQGSEFNYGAYLKAKDGVLMFGGTNGLNFFKPKEIIKNNFIPPVDISGIKINNKNYIYITDSIFNIDLKYNENDINIDFTALSFSQAQKNQYAYKLEGFDLEWKYVGNNKTATYTNLDKGNYTFKVKASNNNNLWNTSGKSIHITILPAPWRTWWAYTIYIIILIIAFYFVQRLILIRVKERNELKQEKFDRERLEEINQMKLTLFTNISHDFRTPLTLIIGPLQRMIHNKMGDNEIQKQHQIMHRNANMLLELINQLLDFRKSESGKQLLYASQSDIVSFVKNIKKAFDDLADFKQFKFDFISTEESLPLWFDKIKMKKILYNLLSNAFKYNEIKGKIAIKISIQEANSQKYAVIKIINYGEVIPSENLHHIFDRYYRFDKEGKQKGTGIGLALTKSLVELHHGNITATSSLEKGTCFKVMIPLGKNHLTSAQCIEHREEDLPLEKSFLLEKNLKILEQESLKEKTTLKKNMDTILLVEDNIDVRNFVKDIFKNQYNILEAEHGKEALEIIKTSEVQLVLSDVMMPEMDGFELCQHIKQNIVTSHIPVLLLTAKTATEHQKTGFHIGADAYIAKPFDASILALRVTNLLNTRKNLVSKFKKDQILEPKEITTTSADEEFLKKAIEIIEKNISDGDFNVKEFTEQMHMSRSVIYKKIKALTDQSITEFIRTIKLKKAAQMIAKTQLSISEIAYEIGFNDLKYFRSCFKKQFNTVPSNYRAQNSKLIKDSE
ncbi:two-component regulator propeller domain-containing protein [Wenyingzhuangia sp. 2_MG-2023]|uniref:hybrid sensor histidine kinase/response regulator transcription factor n=1 Tax=Wenyingzhuangia sp. 2_MG-2023 TaxID=3062639 RepID=UPI0026E3C05D|nr:two-component regulator propeller domain-containing protein [Wenyingzhuangia sp. 2_MG-2023]MDO6738813.1 two-component regulator propeller domain-containing protein [Wenyingzhuangia sp. 2_MG-2023]